MTVLLIIQDKSEYTEQKGSMNDLSQYFDNSEVDSLMATLSLSET